MKHYILVLLSLFTIQISAQENRQYNKFMNPGDSILMVNLPQLKLPASYKAAGAKDLPDYHNNSENEYFRPVFSQYGWSCGQASSVGYSLTYELNRLNNTAADIEDHQYPPLFAFNFFNKGEDGVGVCYLYTLDAVKHNGNPNVTDYGSMGESLTHWADGYDVYYNGMSNKIDEIYSILVGDEEGLLTLKNYMYDHLDGSETGGIVNFYTDLYSTTTLPNGTPEAGKAVITEFGPYTGHSMTFVGWNDSVRWDYNNDGQYTNDLDINNDGEVTMKDWEIGGVILANSWGDDWGDDGFCYVMYNVLAKEKMDGGIWNKQVNVIKVKEDYEPQLTFKVKLTHDSRNKLKVTAGISADTNDALPHHTLEFPIFNYQGGDNYMQGDNYNNSYKTLEFGLDVSPLLSYIQPGDPARFFLQVNENDPNDIGTGLIDEFALMDYTGAVQEIVSSESNVPLNENGLTTTSVVHTLTWDDVEIETEELPAFVSEQPYTAVLTASGGSEPLRWSIAPVYSDAEHEEDYPATFGEQITPNNNQWGFATQSLEFPFPFYDRIVDTVFMHVDGFIKFDEAPYPLPYQVEDLLVFKNEAVVSAFMNKEMHVNTSAGNKLWYEGDAEHATFRWETQVLVNGTNCDVDVTVSLYPDGTIEIFQDLYTFTEQSGKITGISCGDGINFIMEGGLFATSSEQSLKYVYSPQNYPSETTITEDGILNFSPLSENKIFNIAVKVTDNNNISDLKIFQVSDGITYIHTIESGSDDQIDFGETTFVNFSIKNIGDQALTDINLTLESDDPYVEWIDNSVLIGTLNGGEVIDLIQAISFTMNSIYPDGYSFTLDAIITSQESGWESRINLTAYAPALVTGTPVVDDGDNNRLDPGETTDVIIPMMNAGLALAENVQVSMITNDPLITINNNSGSLVYGDIASGGVAYDTLNITISEDATNGHLATFNLDISAQSGIQLVDSLSMLIGRYPVFVADLDPELLSGPYIKQGLEELNVPHFYDFYIPSDLEDYQNIFVVLGRNFGQHILTDAEGQKLADFLNSGGNIYMEGGLTWYDDPQTAVHPMFNIISQYVGWTQIDSVIGNEDTFLDTLLFDYVGDAMYYNSHLLPTGTGFTILHANEEDHNYTIANAAEGYKTVGSTLDFGGFIDGSSPSTKYHLLGKILQFFDVDVVITGMDENETAESMTKFECFPNPVSDNMIVRFKLQEPQKVSIRITDIQGNVVQVLESNRFFGAGSHELFNRTSGLSQGIYLVTLRSSTETMTLKLIKSE